MGVLDTVVGGALTLAGGTFAIRADARRVGEEARKSTYQDWSTLATQAATTAYEAVDYAFDPERVRIARHALDEVVSAHMALMITGAPIAIVDACRDAARTMIGVREGSLATAELRSALESALLLMRADVAAHRSLWGRLRGRLSRSRPQ